MSVLSLASDVRDVLNSLPLSAERASALGIDAGMMAGARVKRALSKVDRGNTPYGSIYPSEVGKSCRRALWYDRWYDPSTMLPKEALTANTKLKFMYGDLIESIAIPLIKATGRKVTGVDERFEKEIKCSHGLTWKVSGRTDLIVDDCVIDIKSMSGISYKMFTSQGIPKADTFGYRWQLHTYNWMLDRTTPSALFAINKENGAVSVINNEPTVLLDVENRLKTIANTVGDPNTEPARLPVEPEGMAGNTKLSTTCSYCKFKDECWRLSNNGFGLRKFLYAGNKVTYLTDVIKLPKVQEITNGSF